MEGAGLQVSLKMDVRLEQEPLSLLSKFNNLQKQSWRLVWQPVEDPMECSCGRGRDRPE